MTEGSWSLARIGGDVKVYLGVLEPRMSEARMPADTAVWARMSQGVGMA